MSSDVTLIEMTTLDRWETMTDADSDTVGPLPLFNWVCGLMNLILGTTTTTVLPLPLPLLLLVLLGCSILYL